MVTCTPLPAQEADFFALLRVWFPCIYDIKYLMRSCKTLKGGLQDVADDLQVSRIGQQHQAGSDSLLTATTFFKMRQKYFDGTIDDAKYLGVLYGFSSSSSHINGTVHYNQTGRPTSVQNFHDASSVTRSVSGNFSGSGSGLGSIFGSPFKSALGT